MTPTYRLWRLWLGGGGLAAFIAYTITLTLLTHWPGLTVEGPVPRTDLWIHAGVFGLWTVLLAGSGLVGRRLGLGVIARSIGIAVVWAGLNEWSQQFVSRTTAWDDFVANCVGVALAAVGLAAIATAFRTRKAR